MSLVRSCQVPFFGNDFFLPKRTDEWASNDTSFSLKRSKFTLFRLALQSQLIPLGATLFKESRTAGIEHVNRNFRLT